MTPTLQKGKEPQPGDDTSMIKENHGPRKKSETRTRRGRHRAVSPPGFGFQRWIGMARQGYFLPGVFSAAFSSPAGASPAAASSLALALGFLLTLRTRTLGS